MTLYRKKLSYRKPPVYRGQVAGVSGWNNISTFRSTWVLPERLSKSYAIVEGSASPTNSQKESQWKDHLSRINRFAELPFTAPSGHDQLHSLQWQLTSLERSSLVTSIFGTVVGYNQVESVVWQDYLGQFSELHTSPFNHVTPHNEIRTLPWSTRSPHGRLLQGLWKAIAARGGYVALPWGPAGARSSPTQIDWHVDPPPPEGTVAFLQQPVYFMLPTLSVVTLPDRTPVEVLSMVISADVGSWSWTFSASIVPTALALVNPETATTPVEIEITINGYIWTMIVERFQDNRKFGDRSISITGRSRLGLLSDPFSQRRSYTEDSTMNASQLADQELTDTGWTLNWTAIDWSVPAGAFSYQNLTPVDAILQVAASIGAVVMADPETKTVHVSPSYPVSPWAWGTATPYALVPAEVLASASGDWEGGTNANGVYVWCERTSYSGLVKITGTDGSAMLQMVVDPLTVSTDPARERGRVEIAKAGRKKKETMIIPLLPAPITEDNPGLLPLGKLIEVTEPSRDPWRGMVSGVSVSASKTSRALSVRQTVTVERQYR